ncbi:protein spaetzle-like [Cylas formicarius]|uniref:protein spaetzle-like n=1 Tax=Cylas formicarius TaxID=197179 RepID=UPI002958B3CF|nr:protein spaetzle-like [Cylas formicarius]
MDRCIKVIFIVLLMLTYTGCSESGSVGRKTGEPQNRQFLNSTNRHGGGKMGFSEGHGHWNSHDNDDDMYFPNEFLSEREHFVSTRRDTTSDGQRPNDQSVPDYPFSEIRQLLDKNPLLKQYFKPTPEIGTRDKEDAEEYETLCDEKTSTQIYPKKLKNINNVEVLVVNDDKEYTQAVEYKQCGTSDGQCKIQFDNFGYVSKCVQKYSKKQLMVFQNATKSIVFDTFKVPSCCVCVIKRV